MLTMGAVEFGVFIRRTRRALDVKQEDMAKRLGVSQAAISDIERGDRKNIDEEYVERVVRALCEGSATPGGVEEIIDAGLREAGIFRVGRAASIDAGRQRILDAYNGVPDPVKRARLEKLFLTAVELVDGEPPDVGPSGNGTD